jgi:hypothetical protein
MIAGILAATGRDKKAPNIPNKLAPIKTAKKTTEGKRARALL